MLLKLLQNLPKSVVNVCIVSNVHDRDKIRPESYFTLAMLRDMIKYLKNNLVSLKLCIDIRPKIDEEEVQFLQTLIELLGRCTSLKEFNLDYSSISKDDLLTLLNFLATHPSLETLSLNDIQIQHPIHYDKERKVLRDNQSKQHHDLFYGICLFLQKNTKLKNFSFDYPELIADTSLASDDVKKLLDYTNSWREHSDGCFNNDHPLKALENMKMESKSSLESLSFIKCEIGFDKLKILSNILSHFQRVESLCLKENPLFDLNSMEFLAKILSGNKRLHTFSLDFQLINKRFSPQVLIYSLWDEGLLFPINQALKSLIKNTTLRTLYLPKFIDSVQQALSTIAKHPTIETLFLPVEARNANGYNEKTFFSALNNNTIIRAIKDTDYFSKKEYDLNCTALKPILERNQRIYNEKRMVAFLIGQNKKYGADSPIRSGLANNSLYTKELVSLLFQFAGFKDIPTPKKVTPYPKSHTSTKKRKDAPTTAGYDKSSDKSKESASKKARTANVS